MKSVKYYMKGIFYRIGHYLVPKIVHKRKVLDTAEYHDMYLDDNEKYYAKLYLYFINNKLQENFADMKLKILDVGCGQGRLSIPLAEMGHVVEGIDISPTAIKSAKKYAFEKNVTNIIFHTKDIEEPFSEVESEKYDCILCTEVLLMVEKYEDVIRELFRMLKKGGILFIAFRDKYFYLTHTIKNKRFKQAEFVLSNQGGTLGRSLLNWHSKKEILEILSQFDLKNIEFNGIGICSGIEGDPLSSIVEPKYLTPAEQDILFKIETSLSKDYPHVGRYVLTSSIKY